MGMIAVFSVVFPIDDIFLQSGDSDQVANLSEINTRLSCDNSYTILL